MKEPMALRELIAELEKTHVILDRNVQFFQEFTHKDFPKLGQSTAAAMVYSQIFGDFYTCVETLLFRIAQTFENSLQSETWHKSLLHKMTLEIEGVRIAVISDATYNVLSEILRFRHFKQYYFDFDYDWDRLALVEKNILKPGRCCKRICAALKHFYNDLCKRLKYCHQIKKPSFLKKLGFSSFENVARNSSFAHSLTAAKLEFRGTSDFHCAR